MQNNIDRILNRANHILMTYYHDESVGSEQKQALDLAYSRLNGGQSIDAKRKKITLPEDVDGLETVSAARFVAQAMGLRFIGNTDLETTLVGAGDMVVVIVSHSGDVSGGLIQKQKAGMACLYLEIKPKDQALSPFDLFARPGDSESKPVERDGVVAINTHTQHSRR